VVAHVEIDMDANPRARRRLSVMSLPTTFIFDADGVRATAATACPRPLTCGPPGTAVGLITMSLGKLSGVSARLEVMLTKRRAVDLCRVAGSLLLLL
jgi:hypothetical protein